MPFEGQAKRFQSCQEFQSTRLRIHVRPPLRPMGLLISTEHGSIEPYRGPQGRRGGNKKGPFIRNDGPLLLYPMMTPLFQRAYLNASGQSFPFSGCLDKKTGNKGIEDRKMMDMHALASIQRCLLPVKSRPSAIRANAPSYCFPIFLEQSIKDSGAR